MAVIGNAWGLGELRPRQKVALWGVCFLFTYILKIVFLSLGAPSTPVSQERIDAADHGQDLEYYRVRDIGSEDVGDEDEELDELGEDMQNPEEVGGEVGNLRILAQSCRAWRVSAAETRNFGNSARTCRALRVSLTGEEPGAQREAAEPQECQQRRRGTWGTRREPAEP